MKRETSKEPQAEPAAWPWQEGDAAAPPPMPAEVRTGDSVERDAAGNVVAVNGKPVAGEA